MRFIDLLECICKKKDFEIYSLPEYNWYIIKAWVGREEDYYTYISPENLDIIIEKVNDLNELKPYVECQPWLPVSHLNGKFTNEDIEELKKNIEETRNNKR